MDNHLFLGFLCAFCVILLGFFGGAFCSAGFVNATVIKRARLGWVLGVFGISLIVAKIALLVFLFVPRGFLTDDAYLRIGIWPLIAGAVIGYLKVRTATRVSV